VRAAQSRCNRGQRYEHPTGGGLRAHLKGHACRERQTGENRPCNEWQGQQAAGGGRSTSDASLIEGGALSRDE
jgi:hypothetical protein